MFFHDDDGAQARGDTTMEKRQLLALLMSLTMVATAAVAEDWPQFRGPGGDGARNGFRDDQG